MKELERQEHHLRSLTGKAIGDFSMIEDGDRVLVALSGGKDSWTLLHILELLRRRAPIRFDLVAVTVHPGFPGFQTSLIEAYTKQYGYSWQEVHAPIHELLLEKLTPEETPCALCSRLRRGVLYTRAVSLGCTKIALGHHRDDFIETLLLNQLFNGTIKAMAPLLRSDDGRNIVIRPLMYVPESTIVAFVSAAGFPVTCCACPSCGDPDQKRVAIKKQLDIWEREHPGIKASLMASLGNVAWRHLALAGNRTVQALPERSMP
ncbi:MAG: tRNA 2-thiocytidine(32) synthetase TtcA [Nitrospirota bacterium]|nr:tRNA 2-thiocytidine(32) synthetase TtcA [Nitrospirota bacterium]